VTGNQTELTMVPNTIVGRPAPVAVACAGRPRKPLPLGDSGLGVL